MKLILLMCALSCAMALPPGPLSTERRQFDLDPSVAQQIIEQQDQTLKYAPKIETHVPAVRYLGNEPHHVLEDIYLARQYHGQDGVGGYIYGYDIPDITKTERKKPDGDLRGSYNYITGDGKEIKVQYWDDGTGFHQIDNVPQILPQQVDDSPEVKAAKEKFLARWHQEAERNSHPIADPNAEAPYDQHSLYQQKSIPNQIDYSGQYSENQNVYAKRKQEEEEETTGPPKGFFYSYDYPVGIIVAEQGLVKKGELGNVYSSNKANYESQLRSGRQAPGSSQSSYLYVKK